MRYTRVRPKSERETSIDPRISQQLLRLASETRDDTMDAEPMPTFDLLFQVVHWLCLDGSGQAYP